MKILSRLLLALLLSIGVYAATTTGAEAATYKVVKGDTLSSIAKKYKTTYKAIMQENGLKSDKIKVGQVLKINEKKSTTASKKTTTVNTTAKKTTATTNNQGARIIAEAKKYLGVPYKYGGYSTKGFDCAGYVAYVYNRAGKKLERSSAAAYHKKAKRVSTPQVGDLVFFSNTYKKGISHVGIYMGNGQMINASGKKVQIVSLKSSYWKSHFTSYGRI